MGSWQLRKFNSIYLLFVAASLLLGTSIPAYYDWTGTDQSRPAPVVARTALGLVITAGGVWLALPWIQIPGGQLPANQRRFVRCNIQTLLVATSLVAVTCAIGLKFPLLIGGSICGAALCCAIFLGATKYEYLLPIITVVACMIFPFAWVVEHRALSSSAAEILRIASGLPALLPTMLISNFLRQHVEQLQWFAMLWTGLELLMGVWLVRLGHKQTIAYLVLVLLLSTFGSFALNAMIRI